MENLTQSLLGWPAIKALNLFSNVGSFHDVKEFVKIRFPNVSSGLEKLGSPYQIKLKHGAKPFRLPSPRRIPLPLEEAVIGTQNYGRARRYF